MQLKTQLQRQFKTDTTKITGIKSSSNSKRWGQDSSFDIKESLEMSER